MTNVIPLFDRKLPRTRNEARTHFLLEHPRSYDDMTTLCGREATGIIDKDTAYPECEACIEEHRELTGWAFPLPAVVTTA